METHKAQSARHVQISSERSNNIASKSHKPLSIIPPAPPTPKPEALNPSFVEKSRATSNYNNVLQTSQFIWSSSLLFLKSDAFKKVVWTCVAVMALFLLVWITLYIIAVLRDSAGNAHKHVQCPVLLTDEADFKGNVACYDVGDYEHHPSGNKIASRDVNKNNTFIEGTKSILVRPGYRLRAYAEPGGSSCEGSSVLNVQGPYEFTANTTAESKKIKSLQVTFGNVPGVNLRVFY